MQTKTRADLADAIHKKVGLPRGECAGMVDAILELIVERLIEREEVKLSGFATFKTHAKKERIGRNPKTGEEAIIEPRTTVTFKASQILKHQITRSMRKQKRP